jgi:DNA-binding XRE family transcriptional regulator
MDHRIKSYARPLRRQWALTQRELAFLVGVKSSTVISRIEGLKRIPNLATALGYALVFGLGPVDLFPGYMAEVQTAVHGRVNELYEQLQGDPSKGTRVKLDFLETVLARLEEERDAQV